ncbi:SMP-30/gluconolactonase/LRE family protein [Arsenicibacter rosenii]|uniref:Gluconolactonase n=1 Tax=Arsenicibacter rosenii TaxID=1750698 RepID=A0A1S2VQG1_9BACT|nr:SMP-30/gluconolactonase/LRE family protein [Arsenicibacter rosenii]OIN61009.1 gluconolactonase [Arsenicibacter rosenii]
MKTGLFLALWCAVSAVLAQTPAETYPDDPASVEQAGVPKGEVLKFTFEKSAIYPGTWREYWVYVPAQYSPDKPACVYVNQDGIQWKAPAVFDNLIHQGKMPVTIGVFVTPGRVRAANPDKALDRYNRSFEYDGLGDAYARFILDELLPEVEKQKTGDGRVIRLSTSGNDRAIGGSSSGAVCAFTAAWERPDAFSRVFSAIGTYVGLRGGDRYSTLVRKTEPKPIRVFLQDGANDLNIYAGDWWKANEAMERALTFAGYEVQHVWGEGGHNGKHGTAVFPEAMRWLWKDWPAPVATGKTKNQFLSDILLPGEGWQTVSPPARPATRGRQPGKQVQGPDRQQYMLSSSTGDVMAYDQDGKARVLVKGLRGNDLVAAHNGDLYITVTGPSEGSVYLVRNKHIQRVDTGLRSASGLALTPDQTQLYVLEPTTHWIWLYTILPDGRLANKQQYGWLHVPDTTENAGATSLACDKDGRVYVATSLGVQVLDQVGRVNAILPLPTGQPQQLYFGGPDHNLLHIVCGDKTYARKLNVQGVKTYEAPVKPGKPKL